MQIRLDYKWIRENGATNNHAQHDFMIDSDANNINSKSSLNNYLRSWAKGWTGKGQLEIVCISQSYIDENLALLSGSVKGQKIEFNNGKVVFKRR